MRRQSICNHHDANRACAAATTGFFQTAAGGEGKRGEQENREENFIAIHTAPHTRLIKVRHSENGKYSETQGSM